MPVLDDIYKTKSIVLPVSGATVEIVTVMSVEDDIEITSIKDDQEQSVVTVLKAIRDWDFTDSEGAKLPITVENVRRIPNFDGQRIIQEFTKSLVESNPNRPKELETEAFVVPAEPIADSVDEVPAEETEQLG